MSNSPFDWLTQNIPSTDDEKAAQLQNDEQIRSMQLQDVENARLFFDVFSSGRGPELLEHLRACTIEVPLMDVGRSIVRGEVALAPSDWAYVREGQNSIVRYIESRMKVATMPVELPANTENSSDD